MRPVDSSRSLVRFAISLPDGMRLVGPATTSSGRFAGRDTSRVCRQRALVPPGDGPMGCAANRGRSSGRRRDLLATRFFARWTVDRLLAKTPIDGRWPISGGPHVRSGDSPTLAVWLGASWGPDDEILLGDGLRGILHVGATGGQAEPLITLKEGERASYPQALPGGQWVLFFAASRWCGGIPRAGRRAVANDRRAADPGRGRTRRAISFRSGHMLYGQGNAVLAQAVPNTIVTTLVGGPVPVLDGVADTAGDPGLHLSVGFNRHAALVPTSIQATATTSRLVQVTRDGTRSPTLRESPE